MFEEIFPCQPKNSDQDSVKQSPQPWQRNAKVGNKLTVDMERYASQQL